MKRFAWIGFFLIFLLPVRAYASTIYAGTGQAVSSAPNVSAMGQAAATEAKNAYNASGGSASPPKVIIVMENIGDSNGALFTAIRSVFGTSVPIVGTQEGWGDYTPYTLKQIPPLSTDLSLSILALGGDAISTVTWATGIGNFNANDNAQAQIGGKDLATKLTPVAGKNNLLLLMGPLHTPLNEYVVAGMKQVYGTSLPSNLKIIGWSGSYWGGTAIANGVVKNNQITGILLSGDYKWAFSGINYGTLGWDGKGTNTGNPIMEIPKHYQNIATELGKAPTVSFMVIAHPERTDFPAIRDAIAGKIGTNAMIGMHGGSETGHDKTANDVIPDADHFFLAGITGNSGTIATPLPTAPPVCTGDINGDKFVDLSDYNVLVQNFFKSPLTNTNADITGDGGVDLSDYSLLVRNFFATCL